MKTTPYVSAEVRSSDFVAVTVVLPWALAAESPGGSEEAVEEVVVAVAVDRS